MDTLTDDTEGCYFNRTVKFFYEASGKNISDHWRKRDYAIVSLGMSVCVIVIFSNILVISAIIKNRRFHFPIYYLLGNLALADLFAGTSLGGIRWWSLGNPLNTPVSPSQVSPTST